MEAKRTNIGGSEDTDELKDSTRSTTVVSLRPSEHFGTSAQLLLAFEFIRRFLVLNQVIVLYSLCVKNGISYEDMFQSLIDWQGITMFLFFPLAWIADSYCGKINMLLINFSFEIIVGTFGFIITFVQLNSDHPTLLLFYVILESTAERTSLNLREIVILELFRLPEDSNKVRSCVFLFYILNCLAYILFGVGVRYIEDFPDFELYTPRVLLISEACFTACYFTLVVGLRRFMWKGPVYFRFADKSLMCFWSALKGKNMPECCTYELDSKETPNQWIEPAYEDEDENDESKKLVIKETKKLYLFLLTVFPLFLCLGNLHIPFEATYWLLRGLVEIPYQLVSITACVSLGKVLGALILELVLLPYLLKKQWLTKNLERVKVALLVSLFAYIFDFALVTLYIDDVGHIDDSATVNLRIYNELPSTATLEAKWLNKLVISPFSVALVTNTKLHLDKTYLLQVTSSYLNKTIEIRVEKFGTTSMIISKTDVSVCPSQDPVLRSRINSAIIQILVLPEFPQNASIVLDDLDGNVLLTMKNITICKLISVQPGKLHIAYRPIKRSVVLKTAEFNRSAVYSLIINLEHKPKVRLTVLSRPSTISPLWLVPQFVALFFADPLIVISINTFKFLEIPSNLRTVGFAAYIIVAEGMYYWRARLPRSNYDDKITTKLVIEGISFHLAGMLLFFQISKKFKYDYPC